MRAGEAGDETGEALARAMAAYYRHHGRSAARRTSSRRSSSKRAAGSRRRRITRGWPTSGRHSATASRTRAAAPTTGLRRPSRRSTTAGSPVARARPRPISGSPWSSGRGRRTRRSRRSSACSRRRGRRGCCSAAPGCSPCSTAARRPGRTPWRRSARLREQSGHRWADWYLAEISTLAGDHEDASNRLRVVCDWLEATEQLRVPRDLPGPSSAVHCACSVASTKRSRSPSARDRSKRRSAATRCRDYLWRQVLARVHAHRGELAEAERLAREAVAASEQTDSLDDQCRRPVGPGGGSGGGRAPRRGGSRARAGARPLPAEEEPRAGPPSPRAARGAAGGDATGAVMGPLGFEPRTNGL